MVLDDVLQADIRARAELDVLAFDYVFLAKNDFEREALLNKAYSFINGLPKGLARQDYLKFYASSQAGYLAIREKESKKDKTRGRY